jgi:transcriptional regulator with XRE-family HTH domain
LNPISDVLVQYREYAGLTQKSLVETLSTYNNEFKNLNTVTMSRWETGTTTPSLHKKKLLLHFFANTQCLTSDGACHDIVHEAYERLYEPLSTVFTKNYQSLIGNLPEQRIGQHKLENLKVFPQKDEHIEHILDIEKATNATNYYAVKPTLLTQWCNYPSTFCIVAERKKQHLGHFVMLKLKNHVAEEIAHHKRSEFDLNNNDFCDVNESGTYYVHALYGRSPKIAAELNVKAYLHLFDHLKHIDNVMIFSTRTDGVLLTKDYGIQEVAHGVDEEYEFEWHGMLSPVEDILFSDTVLKLVF